ncbi:retroviral-like aspartic protease family protein [Halosquirtibacter laminarini]|uniref:Retroviral-like aspartic protease family protein n=1 Tax=Halosquirtibacter laminarini TaxID=3374600 RepID=A0AC61NNW6_9BACT|nr:retroviral-like aspartic protease family protein [Prolixibacteraceae bacterium]
MNWKYSRREFPIEVVNIDEDGVHIVCKNRLAPGYWWIIDTGASTSVIDTNCSDHFEIVFESTTQAAVGVLENQVETKKGNAQIIDIEGHLFENIDCVVIPLNHVNEIYQTQADIKICGIIGCDLLVDNKAVIDLAKLKIRLKNIR